MVNIDSIEEQYQKITEEWPNAQIFDNVISHVKIPLKNGNFIDIDFKNYPKKPKVRLVNSKGQVYKKLDINIPILSSWKSKNTPAINDIIIQMVNMMDNLILNEINVKKELLIGILALCREQHPREILGLLRLEGSIITEFILPPGALTSTKSGIFFPHRIPFDLSLKGTIHSHPSGNPYPSSQDLESIFTKMQFHFITGFPYNLQSTKCFDRNGNELKFNLIP